MKRFMSLFLRGAVLVPLFVLVLSGCSKKPAEAAGTAGTGGLDTSRRVEISLYVISDEPAKQSEIYDNLNKMLIEKLNCTLKINWIPWAEFTNKYSLLFSSGEVFDLAYAATWLNFAPLAQKGAFMELDELFPKYAPKNYARQSKTALQQATINGHIYAIPTLQATYSAYGPIYRAELALPYGWDGKMETMADYEKYLQIVKDNNPGIEPIDIYSFGSEIDSLYIQNDDYFMFKGTDFLFFDPRLDHPRIIPLWEYEHVNDFLTMIDRWNKAGFYPKNALSDTDSAKLRNGKSASRIHNPDSWTGEVHNNPQWDIRYANFVGDISNLPFTQDALAVSNTSKNPERALALYDLITNDEEVWRAFFYGIEGKSYEIEVIDGQEYVKPINVDDYGFSALWAARTNEFVLPTVGDPPELKQMKAEWDSRIKDGVRSQKFQSLQIDTTSVETEFAACIAAHHQYWWPLELGYVDASHLAEYKEKMEAAGIEKVRAVLQAQMDSYLAGLN
ncbi:MAG: ABC transporter substrate-binding protein [Spirochaetaceae bacterium]|nr:ABC transporter substrate-binding protein [Spirochaetaceae bacterium]